MPSCQRADARAGCPPIRASARTGGRYRSPAPMCGTWRLDGQHPSRPSSRPSASEAGRTDAVRKHGGRRAWVARETCAHHRSRNTRDRRTAHPAAGVTARLEPPMPSCQRADPRAGCPPIRASARTGGRYRSPAPTCGTWRLDGQHPSRPSSRPSASEAGRTDAVRKHGGRRAWVARETCAHHRSRANTGDRPPGRRRYRAPGATHALLPARGRARWLSSHPRIRADGRTVTAPIVAPGAAS
jgi:hypothetical protein